MQGDRAAGFGATTNVVELEAHERLHQRCVMACKLVKKMNGGEPTGTLDRFDSTIQYTTLTIHT